MGGRGASVSYDYDFTGMADGALPAELSGSTWSISGGKATNSLTLGAELLTDGSLEAAYTAGKCDTLTAGGSPTVEESADTHAGSKAQAFTATANSNFLKFADTTSATGKWFLYSGWGKRTAGTNNRTFISVVHNGFPGVFVTDRLVKDATYTQKIFLRRSTAATVEKYAVNNGASFDSAIVDDFSFKQVTESALFATRTFASANATTRIYIDQNNNNGTVGVVARLDSASNPQNYIAVAVEVHAAGSGTEVAYISMAKVVGGTCTVLIAPVSLSALVVNGDYIEVVCSDNDVSMYYNGVQKGTTQTVSDAGIISNTIFGFFGGGGGLVNRFFLGV